MKRYIKNKSFGKWATLVLVSLAFLFLIASNPVQAQSAGNLGNTEFVDVSDSKFKFIVCDGPEKARLPGDKEYVVCDFNAVMMQVQRLINIAIVVGILVAIAGLCFAGYLMITGTQANIKKAKDIFPKIAFGFIIMLSAWFIVYQILDWLTGNSGFSALLGPKLR